LRLVEYGVPGSFGGLLVSVIGGNHPVLQRRIAHALCERAVRFRQLEAELGCAERLAHFEEVVELRIFHLFRRCELMAINFDTRVVIELAELFEFVHRGRETPRLQLFRGRLLLRSHRAAPAAATAASSTAAARAAASCTTAAASRVQRRKRSAGKPLRRRGHELNRADSALDNKLE